MREGLRSRTRLREVSGGEGVIDRERVSVKDEAFDLGGDGSAPQLDSATEQKDVVGRVVKEECELVLNVTTSGIVDLSETENGNKSCFSGGGDLKEAEVERKAKEEDDSNNKVLIGGRVLRPRTKKEDGKNSCNGENDGVVCRKGGEQGGFERVVVKKEYEEGDEFINEGYGNERVELKKEGNGQKNLKRKRGRPPKIEFKEQDELAEQLPRKKRGRPPKAGRRNHLLTGAHDRKGKVVLRKGKRGLSMRDGANANEIDDSHSRRSSGKELEKKGYSLVKKNKLGKVLKTENNGVASPLRSNTSKALVAEKSGKNKVKQLVRDKIMERLSAAGWTVDYRPRNGKEYNDAVYVSLDGKTHWSITLAYNRLKRHYEAGDGEGKVYGPGFKFTPIPAEDFNILTKVINKKRKGKTQKRGKGGETVDGVNRKAKKEKSGSDAGMDKSVKGKMKRKRSLLEEGSSAVTSPNRTPVLVRDHKRHKTQNKKRCALLVRNTKEEIDSEVDGCVPYSGKRNVLAWMIDLGTILKNGKVYCMQNSEEFTVLDGTITSDGIHCGCCNEIVTISDFEAHAGSKLSDPLRNIYIEGGNSLLQCMLDSWNKQDESERKDFHFVDVAGEDPNDDTCGVCGDGGDLICCDGCPSTFHQSCLDIQKFPSGDWHCIYCSCKFCGLVGGSSNRRDSCDNFTVSSLLTCHLCEEKYHRSCIEANAAKTDDFRYDVFCGNKCQELSERLEMFLGVKHEIEDGFSLIFVRRSDVGVDASQIKPQTIECNSKLAVALSIMDECFMPHIDHRSGINLIHSILYNCGSNFKRLDHSGFITAILERGDEIISAASIRIHGNKLAEMPFIGTRYMYRRQGMCRRLLNAIEWALSSLNVELLVIPAVSELRETWTSVFGFEPLELTSKEIIKNMNLLVFPHVDMLQKKISKNKFADENLIPMEGAGPSASDLIISAGIPPSNACQINDKTASIESGCQLPETTHLTGSLNNAPDISSNTIYEKSPQDVTCHENLVVEENSTANPHGSVSDTCPRADDASTSKNTSCDCIILNHDEKPIDLNSQLNNCCATYEERQCPNGGCASGEAVLTTNALVHLKSQNITKDLPVNCENNSSVVSALNADDASVCSAKTPNHLMNIKPGDCQSIPVSSGFCEKIVDGVNERSKASNVAEANFLPADTEIVPCDKPWMKGFSELAEPDMQIDQTARNNAPSLCSPNTASGVAIHCASTGSTSCGSTEVIVLSNQAS